MERPCPSCGKNVEIWKHGQRMRIRESPFTHGIQPISCPACQASLEISVPAFWQCVGLIAGCALLEPVS